MSDEPLSVIELEENLADVEKPPVLPAGTYLGEVQEVSVETSQKGNQYFSVSFVIPTNEIPSNMTDFFEDGCRLYYNRLLVPTKGNRRALFNLRKFIEALGLDSNTSAIDPNEWMGRSANLRVTNSKYQGEDRAEISAVESDDGAGEDEPEVKQKRTRRK